MLQRCFRLFHSSGYRNHDKKKSHNSAKSRLRKKAGAKEKESGNGTRRGGSRASSQRPSRSHSDDEEDEGVPAGYHTVSLQVSRDVSTGAFFFILSNVSDHTFTKTESYQNTYTMVQISLRFKNILIAAIGCANRSGFLSRSSGYKNKR